MATIRPHELRARLEGGEPRPLVIDLRDPEEFAQGTVPGARNAPYDERVVARIVRSVDRDRDVVLVCGWGHKSAVTGIALKRAGFRRVRYLEGGLEAWESDGFLLERGATGRALAGDDPERLRAAAGDP